MSLAFCFSSSDGFEYPGSLEVDEAFYVVNFLCADDWYCDVFRLTEEADR